MTTREGVYSPDHGIDRSLRSSPAARSSLWEEVPALAAGARRLRYDPRMSGNEARPPAEGLVEARWGEGDFVEELGDAFWMNPARVRAHLNRLATGSPFCDWLTWFKTHWFPPDPGGALRRCLVLGCGDGWLERALVADRPDLRVDACDIAPGAVARARETARGIGREAIEYSVLDLDREELPADRYDLIVAHSVLHHVAELEHACDQIERSLRPGGLMVVNEYVGPRHLQYTQEALEVIDGLMAALPERYRVSSATSEVLDSKPRPDLGYLLQVDPSEGVRADELDGFVRSRFELLYEADLGGTVLQHLLWQIAHNFRDDEPFDQIVVGLLCAIEECLVAEGALASDYRFYVVGRRDDEQRSLRAPVARLADPAQPKAVCEPMAASSPWRALPVVKAHLHEVATGSAECDWATLALDRLRAHGVTARDRVLVLGESWLAPRVRERFPRTVTIRSTRSLPWTMPRRFAAVVSVEAFSSRPADEAGRLLRRLLGRLRRGGVLLACERLAPSARNQRHLDRLVRAAVPPGSTDPFPLGPARSALPRELGELLFEPGSVVERRRCGGELLEPMLDGGGWSSRGYPADRLAELVGLLVAAERLLRRFSVLDDESTVFLVRTENG